MGKIKQSEYKYLVAINWSDEDQAYIARVPELVGVVTHGDTYEHAARMAEEAIALHLDALDDLGEDAPEPVAKKKFSGKAPLRMSEDLHRTVAMLANREGESFNSYVNKALIEDAARKLRGKSFKVQTTSSGASKRRRIGPQP